jgi:hypothetical protein
MLRSNMKRHSRIHVVVCVLAWGLAGCLATAGPVSVGSVQKDVSGVTMKLESGVLRLEGCDERTIHVTGRRLVGRNSCS